jgi:hypothetical protein
VAALILPSRFARQPQSPVQIDRSNPLTRGLIVAAIPFGTSFYDCVSGQLFTQTGPVVVGQNAEGSNILFVNTVTQYYRLPVKMAATDNVTVASIFAPNNLTKQGTAAAFAEDSGSNAYQWTIGNGYSGTSQWDAIYKDGSGSTGVVNIATPTPATGAPVRMMGRYSLASKDIWVNGVKVASSATATTTWGASKFQAFSIGSYDHFGSKMDIMDGWVNASFGWNRFLSDAEAVEFYRNPWQLFKAPARRIWVAASGSGVNGAIAWLEQNDTSALSSTVSATSAASWTEASDSTAIAASVTVATSATWTEANDSTAIAGAATVSGSASWTEASDSASIAATAQVNAAASWSEVNDTAAIAGLVGNAVTASAAWTEQSDTTAIAASATVTNAAAWTEASDSTNIAASVGNAVAGNAIWTEQNDATAVSAAIRVNAAASWSEANDAAAIAAMVGVAVTGSASWTEQSDSTAVSAAIKVNVAAGWAEQSDLSGFNAQVLATAGIAWTEANDIAAISASSAAQSNLIPNPAYTVTGRARIRSIVGQARIRTATWTN